METLAEQQYRRNREVRLGRYRISCDKGYMGNFETFHPDDLKPVLTRNDVLNAHVRHQERDLISERGGPTPNYPYSSPKSRRNDD